MKVFFQKIFLRGDKVKGKILTQEAKLEHRIQPETESMIKMILETPFVVSQSSSIEFSYILVNFPKVKSLG